MDSKGLATSLQSFRGWVVEIKGIVVVVVVVVAVVDFDVRIPKFRRAVIELNSGLFFRGFEYLEGAFLATFFVLNKDFGADLEDSRKSERCIQTVASVDGVLYLALCTRLTEVSQGLSVSLSALLLFL